MLSAPWLWQQNGGNFPRLGRLFGRMLLFSSLLTAVAILPVPSLGADSPARQDDQVLIHARNALSRTPGVKPKNLFIKVRDGVATIGGDVSSKAMADETVRILMQVQGIYEVKSNLTIHVEKEPLIPLRTPTELPTKNESAFIDSRTNKLGTLAGRTPEPLPVSITGGPNRGQRPEPPNPFPPNRSEEASLDTRRRNGAQGALVTLGSPLPSPEPVGSFKASVNQIVQEETRFQGLVFDIRDGQTIVVDDNSARADDVTAFVTRLRTIQGVRAVTIKIADRQ